MSEGAGQSSAAATRLGGLPKALALAGVGVLASIVALSIDTRLSYLLLYAWFGIGYGLLLQYGRFCMASAVRDLFAVRVPRMAVGMMIAVALYALVSAAVTLAGFGTVDPDPVGWHILIGAAIFGFGMVFTGGCASGSLYKAGEGNVGAMLVIVAISLSQAVVVSTGGWFDRFVPASWTATAAADPDVPAEVTVTQGWFDQFTAGYMWTLDAGTLADHVGLAGSPVVAVAVNTLFVAIVPVLLLLTLLYAVYFRPGHMRRAKIVSPTLRQHLAGMWTMCTTSRNTAWAGIGLGLLAGVHVWATGMLRAHYGIENFGELLAAMDHRSGLSLRGTVFDPGYWYITTQEAQWGAWVLESLGLSMRDNVYFGMFNGIPNPLLNAPGFMSIGIIVGAAMMALLRQEFKWKLPNLEGAVFALIGGTLMGIGARVAKGCNIGAFFSTVTNGDPSGWLFLLGMAAGAWVGVKLFAWWVDWQASRQGSDLAL
jgi:uncharacterized membrane protein YedE/YeeE